MTQIKNSFPGRRYHGWLNALIASTGNYELSRDKLLSVCNAITEEDKIEVDRTIFSLFNKIKRMTDRTTTGIP